MRTVSPLDALGTDPWCRSTPPPPRGASRSHRSVLALGVLLAVPAFVVSIPLMWILGAADGLLAAVSGPTRRPSSSWRWRAARVGRFRRNATRPFSAIDPARLRRQVEVALVAALVVAAGVVVVARGLPGGHPAGPVAPNRGRSGSTTRASSPSDSQPAPGSAGGAPAAQVPLSQRPATRGLAYAPELLAEQTRLPLPPGPVGGFTVGDFRSLYTNVVNGERRTLAPPPCRCRPTVVWFTGGSAAFGQGQRDDHTIASAVVRVAGVDGVSLDMHNVAVPGYTLWQEYLGVLARLPAGAPRPAVIAFYDGFNDLTYSVAQAVVRGASWSTPVVYDPAAVVEFRATSDAALRRSLVRAGGIAEVARQASRRYLALKMLVRRQLAAMGIEVTFFFQADALSDPLQRRGGRVGDPNLDDAQLAAAERAIVAAASRGPAGDIDLRPVFDGYPRAVFIDLVHPNEDGAAVLGQAIYDHLRARLRADQGQTSGG